MVRTLAREKRGFEELTLDEWRAHSPLFDADVQDYITPTASVRRKRTPQSTHPDAVAARACASSARGWGRTRDSLQRSARSTRR